MFYNKLILELYELKDREYVLQAEQDITRWTLGQVTDLMKIQTQQFGRVGRVVKINQKPEPEFRKGI